MTVESDNAKEEIREVTEKCIRCGLCKPQCSVYRIVREEQFSPRGMIAMQDSNYYDKILYDCNLCKACEVTCPIKLKICNSIIKSRMILNETNKEFDINKEMIENLKKTGNIYGIIDKTQEDD
jgi:Fe-S oxidoreductase